LYSFVFDQLRANKKVAQVTVEDPNENFDDLRDRCDLRMLLKDRVLEGQKAPLSKEVMMEIGGKYKLSKVRMTANFWANMY
jgi:histone acetyltransferase 1